MIQKINAILDMLMQPTSLMVIGFICEVVLRKWPTKNPKSILLFAKGIVDMIAAILGKISAFLDKIISQVTK